MTITIDLKPEIESYLAEQAKNSGVPIETFIEVFIENKLEEIEKKSKDKVYSSNGNERKMAI